MGEWKWGSRTCVINLIAEGRDGLLLERAACLALQATEYTVDMEPAERLPTYTVPADCVICPERPVIL